MDVDGSHVANRQGHTHQHTEHESAPYPFAFRFVLPAEPEHRLVPKHGADENALAGLVPSMHRLHKAQRWLK